MVLTRRIKKLSKAMVSKISGRHVLTCTECNLEEVEVPADVAKVTCCYCVQKMIAPPAGYKSKNTTESKKPRGWHFKQYYEQDGIVYSKGQIVTDPAEIKALRKTGKVTSPTKVKSTTKKVGRKKKTVSTKSKKHDSSTK
jgi:hypothetical protein